MRRGLPILFMACLMLMACPHYDKEEDIVSEYHCYYEDPFLDNSDTTGIYISVTIDLPVCNSNDSTVLMRREEISTVLIRRFFDADYQPGDDIEEIVTRYGKQAQKRYDEYAAAHPDGPETKRWEYVKGLSIEYLGSYDEVYSFSYVHTDNRGGMFEADDVTFMVYDADNGKEIKEKDIFVDYENITKRKLTELLRGSLEKTIRQTSYLSINDYYIDRLSPNGNFHITDEGIEYYYRAGEIAPRIMGPQWIAIDSRDIKDILDPESSVYQYFFDDRPKAGGAEETDQ